MKENGQRTENKRSYERRHRNEYSPDSTTPVGHLDTTIDRSSKINLFAAVVVVCSVALGVGSGVWAIRGFVHSIEDNTRSMNALSQKMDRALAKIENLTQFSAENRGMIQSLEGEVERMNERLIIDRTKNGR